MYLHWNHAPDPSFNMDPALLGFSREGLVSTVTTLLLTYYRYWWPHAALLAINYALLNHKDI